MQKLVADAYFADKLFPHKTPLSPTYPPNIYRLKVDTGPRRGQNHARRAPRGGGGGGGRRAQEPGPEGGLRVRAQAATGGVAEAL